MTKKKKLTFYLKDAKDRLSYFIAKFCIQINILDDTIHIAHILDFVYFFRRLLIMSI